VGAHVDANWQSATRVRASSPDEAFVRDLVFASSMTWNLRLFANLDSNSRTSGRLPLLQGVRATIAVNNLFNSRPKVRVSGSETPLYYRPDNLDPIGRTIKFSVRKRF
jgi:outer membrane receptor protein involved in Fe transport